MHELEIHITLSRIPTEDLDSFKSYITSKGFKFTHIVLDYGDTPSQPMITKRIESDDLQETLLSVEESIKDIYGYDTSINRVKVECSPYVDINEIKGAVSIYFEHHVKLEFSENIPEIVKIIAKKRDAHMSRNAFKHLQDGKFEMFLTQRYYAIPVHEAIEKFNDLRTDLQLVNQTIVDYEQEMAIHDSGEDIDRGWI